MPFPKLPILVAVGLAVDLNLTINDVFGPASYVAGTGQTIAAATLGLRQKIYAAWTVGVTNDGLNFVEVTTPSGNVSTSAVLRWSVVSTGAEAGNGTNLSGKRVRIVALGV